MSTHRLIKLIVKAFASGDHIVFELQQRSISSLSFHHRSLSLSSFQYLSSDDGGSSS
ncbi:hypothetical protein Bca4012_037791 [Brassica carinata]